MTHANDNDDESATINQLLFEFKAHLMMKKLMEKFGGRK